jgi:hypothetical protein
MSKFHIHTIKILTRDDPEGESIGEVLRDHCNTLTNDGSSIETWEHSGAIHAVEHDLSDLDYDTPLWKLES